MGIREDIMIKMSDVLDKELLDKLAITLDIVLYDYDVVKKSRELMLRDNSNQIVLKNYLGEKHLQGKSKATIKHYNHILEKLLMTIEKPVNEITTNDVRYHLAKLQTENELSLVTLNNIRAIYSSFFGWCETEQIIEDNPMKKIKPFKAPKKQIKPLSEIDIEKMCDACTTTRDRALIEFLYSTGCRVSECAAFNIDDIDFKTKKASVTGKGNKERTVYISDRTMYWLEKYLVQRTDNDIALWIGKKGRLTKSGIEFIVKSLGKSAGLPNVHPHQFRHALATDLIKKNAPVQIVKQILGHEDLSTTMIYVDIQEDEIESIHKKYIS